MNYPTVHVLIDGLNLSHEVLLIPQTSLTKEAQNRKPKSEFRMIRAQSSSLLINKLFFISHEKQYCLAFWNAAIHCQQVEIMVVEQGAGYAIYSESTVR